MTRTRRHDPAGVLVELRPPGGWYQPPANQQPTNDAPTAPTAPPAPPASAPPTTPARSAPRASSALPTSPAGVDLEWHWQAHGNCRGVDPNLFFPERGESTRDAKAVCAGCAVRDECLEHALSRPEKFGIWGGLSERERRRIRRARRLARQTAAAGGEAS